MKRWLMLVGVVMLAVGWQAAAQEDDGAWQLRVPTAEEYLAAVPNIVGGCSNYQYYDYKRSLWSICHIIVSEIEATYSLDELAAQDYDVLLAAYINLAIGEDRNAPGNVGLWTQAMILSWLRSNQPNLDTTTTLEFAHYYIDVESRDFNADGKNEYLFKIDSPAYTTYDIIAWDQSAKSYKFIPNYLPVASMGYAYWEQESGNLEELMFEDVTGDGTPEWLLAYGGYGYRGETFGELLLLSWKNGGMAYIANRGLPYSAPAGGGQPAITGNVGWEFVNLDNDAAREFRQTELYFDNWRCKHEEVLIFDWDQTQQLYLSPGIVMHYDKTRECAMGAAEPNLWEGDYEGAALLYEYALTLPSSENINSEVFAVEQEQYIRARLALAYLMTRQYDDAYTLIDTLTKEKPASGLMEAFINTLVENSSQKRGVLCAALYNVFERVKQISFNYGVYSGHLPSEMVVGLASKFNGVHIGDGTVPDSDKAGCNVPLLMEEQFKQQPFYTSYSPINLLENSDFAIDSFIQSDMDGDGIEEWLIWNMALVSPIFLSDPMELYGSPVYSITRPNVNRADSFTSVGFYDLPEDNGKAIYRLTVIDNPSMGMDNAGYNLASGNCTPESDDVKLPFGVFDLWQLVEGELQNTLHMALCEPQTFQSLFPGGEGAITFQGWEVVSTNNYGWEQLTPATYEWNADQSRYVANTLLNPAHSDTVTITQTPIATVTPNAVESLEMFAYDNTDYIDNLIYEANSNVSTEVGLQMIDDTLANLELADSPWLDKPAVERLLRYQRALIFRATDQEEALLAEYVAIYEAAPESAWGMLARLHIERAT